jgi:hypothetical protein
MRKRELLIIFITIISILITWLLLLQLILNNLSDYLSKSEPIKANVLVVEGWLPDYALEMAYKEFQKTGYEYIITTGMKSYTDYYKLSKNGYLIIYPGDKLSDMNKTDRHIIEIDAASELGGSNSAHFNVFVNDSLIADFYADKHKRRYPVSWNGSLTEIDSFMVQFTNDKAGEFGDRNLFIKQVVVDNKTEIPYQYNSEYDIGELDGKRRIINKFNSYAEFARRTLLSMDIDSSRIISIPYKRVKTKRTLNSALAFREWFDTTKIEVKGINIVSEGAHARRTWMTYNKVLDEKLDIGIISLPDYEYRYSRKDRVLKTFREAIGIVYYWVILLPY